MSVPRLRVFAGPNGSGKSTLFETFSEKYDTGVFLNADKIEFELSTKGFLDIKEFGLSLNQSDLKQFYTTPQAISLVQKAKKDNLKFDISITENIIVNPLKETHSYEAAFVSSFLRHHLLHQKNSFCFETVMSHPSKIDEIIEAKQSGYKTYLYFICIDDPEVNISRVENRVEKGGHPVSPDKIRSRYNSTLENLILAIEHTDKVYLFDNSDTEYRLIAKITNGEMILEVDPENLPHWFINYVLKYFI